MSVAEDAVKFCLKVMINKQKTKVLFAEADSDLADVLLSFLTLPLGTIVRIFDKHYENQAPVIGSLNTLHKGLANLGSAYFWTEGAKMMLLNPTSSYEAECRKLKLNIGDTQPTKYFTCEDLNCIKSREPNVGMYYDNAVCDCGKSLNREIGIKELNDKAAADKDGVFTVKSASFLICDDLCLVPNLSGSIIQTLNKLGILDTDGAEQRNMTLGFNGIMALLKGLLVSNTTLTDLILRRKQMNSTTAKPESVTLTRQMQRKTTYHNRKMFVKVMVQKSTDKFLFAQADKNFVDFLFSFFTIPLGGVVGLLGMNTSLGNVDNFYRSIAKLNGDEYLKSYEARGMLLKPHLPPWYISDNQILPHNKQPDPVLCHYRYKDQRALYVYPSYQVFTGENCSNVSLKDPKGRGSYVKGPGKFMVTDDLTVTPLSMLSSISVLNGLKIPLHDVKEIEIQIGLKEALSILRASLTSSCALTNGLINPIPLKEPKQGY